MGAGQRLFKSRTATVPFSSTYPRWSQRPGPCPAPPAGSSPSRLMAPGCRRWSGRDRRQAQARPSSMSSRGRHQPAADRAHCCSPPDSVPGDPPSAGAERAGTRAPAPAPLAQLAPSRRGRGSPAQSSSEELAALRHVGGAGHDLGRGWPAGGRPTRSPRRTGKSPRSRSVVVLLPRWRDQRHRLAGAHLERDLVHRGQVAVADLDPVKPERVHIPRRGRPRRLAGGWRPRRAAPRRSSGRTTAPRSGGRATSPRGCCARSGARRRRRG